MPYKIVKGSGSKPYKIMKGRTTVGSSKSLKNARASVRARYANEGKRGRG